MKRSKTILFTFLVILLIGFYSCDKEKLRPVVFLADEPGYQVNDTMLAVGDTIKVLIDYTWNGKNKISEIELKVNDRNAGFYEVDRERGQFGVTIIKGLSDPEIWDFYINDDGGNQAQLSMTLTLDPNSVYKAVKYYDGITLGAQNNFTRPGFISMTQATYYNLDGAYQNQSKIDFFFYFGDTDKATIASPGAEIPEGIYPGLQAPGYWTVKNIAFFQKVDITIEKFSGIFHDGFIIENFDIDIATRKATDLVAGDSYLFQLANGKKGLFYVISTEPVMDGMITFAVKIQE